MLENFKSEKKGFNIGSGGVRTPVFTGNVSEFSFGNMQPVKDLEVSLMGSSGPQSDNWNPGFDASIGIKLISKYNFTINLPKSEIFFSPNKSFAN
ncbi:hypothetical protein C3K47_04925 [Solitalea longa]|uniref:Uncharacterized protein n=1 Tax=Solitalea longa TaxID=2079460 RepID=A0A2S5A5Q3_9SPHI|nr:hypothetical protein [Solitalea longa]POY37875.1 hypothetical protein C3K47_04925 [Solitalea longa]